MQRGRMEKAQLEQIKQSGKHRNDRTGLDELKSPNRSMNISINQGSSVNRNKSLNKNQSYIAKSKPSVLDKNQH